MRKKVSKFIKFTLNSVKIIIIIKYAACWQVHGLEEEMINFFLMFKQFPVLSDLQLPSLAPSIFLCFLNHK